MKFLNNIILAISILLIVSCNRGNKTLNNNLNFALEYSDNNRAELEKVLNYYSTNVDDSLKLKAAKFLISNMVGYYSITGELMDQLVKDIDTTLNELSISDKIIYYNIAARIAIDNYNYEIKYDVEHITSEFLINNIDRSFVVWDNNTNNISFKEFCEFILPYRLSNEPLVDWKDYSTSYFILESIKNMQGVKPSRALIRSIKEVGKLDVKQFNNQLLKNYEPDCIDKAYYEAYYIRNFGYPAPIDYVPHYAYKNNRHFWVDYEYLHNRGVKNEYAKVYRKSYSLQLTPTDRDNFMPFYIDYAHNIDITEQYTDVSKIEYYFSNLPIDHKYVYLSVFNNQNWQEVAWAKTNGKTGIFHKMGRDIIYMPTYYVGPKQICGQFPIYLDSNGSIKELKPNKTNTQNLILERKYNYNYIGDIDGIRIKGSHFVATNDSSFNSFDTLATVTSYKYMNYDSVIINTNKRYKYYLLNTNNKRIKISSIRFYDEKRKLINGKSFQIDKDNKITYNHSAAFDNNTLTSTYISNLAGIELENSSRIRKIEFMSSTDDNSITIGDTYELLYFDNGKWLSLGKQIAIEQSLYYEDAPTNALFWLRNLTKGREERPFTVENGKIRFF